MSPMTLHFFPKQISIGHDHKREMNPQSILYAWLSKLAGCCSVRKSTDNVRILILYSCYSSCFLLGFCTFLNSSRAQFDSETDIYVPFSKLSNRVILFQKHIDKTLFTIKKTAN